VSTNTWTFNPLPPDPSDAVRVYVTGPSMVYQRSYQVRRVIGGTLREPMPGPFIADEYADHTPVLFIEDYLFPLDTTWQYELLDAGGDVILDTSPSVGPVASLGYPWVRDLIYPAQRSTPLEIVDITGRVYAGRVSPYYLVAQKYPVTLGDVRSASTGTMTVLCRNHAQRDATLDALSSGGPCQLRAPCTDVVDDMYFTPLDVEEIRVGRRGACVLSVEFVEVSPTELPPFKAISYATQTANATAAGMKYSGLRDAFVFHTYRDMSLSQTGIGP